MPLDTSIENAAAVLVTRLHTLIANPVTADLDFPVRDRHVATDEISQSLKCQYIAEQLAVCHKALSLVKRIEAELLETQAQLIERRWDECQGGKK
jgi:hypothetical protein